MEMMAFTFLDSEHPIFFWLLNLSFFSNRLISGFQPESIPWPHPLGFNVTIFAFAQNSPGFGFLQSAGISYVDAHTLGRDLSNGAGEPGAGPEKPGAKGPGGHDAHGDRSVIKRLVGNGIGGGQAEDYADETNPEHTHEGHGFGHESEPKGTAPKVGGIEEPDENGDAI